MKGNPLPNTTPLSLIPFGYPVHPLVKDKIEKAIEEEGTKLKKQSSYSSVESIIGWTEADWDYFKTPEEVNLFLC